MKKNWLQILIFAFLIGVVMWAGKGIFKYNVFSTHDGDHHIARIFDVIQTAKEGHFPLRWAGSLNYFCGVPIYNFFYPLIYYLSVAVNFFTNNVILTLKIIDFLSLLVGTLFFYLWIREETKKDLAAIGGALTYLYAPYRFSLIFVRGSPEFLAYAVLPIVLYFFALCFNSTGKKFVVYAFLASVSGALLTISHNFTVMFLMPIILVFLIIKIYVLKVDIKKILWIGFSFLSAFGMGSFFIGPALLEQKFTRIGQGFLQWRDHFPTLGQMFKSDWGYFYSALRVSDDGMSFMLGYAQWFILGIVAIFIIFQIFKSKFKLWKVFNENIYIIFFFILSLLTIYLILPVSIPVWEKIERLQEIQFSWRLLGIAIFTISALFSFLLARINSKPFYLIIFLAVSLLTVVGTRNFMLPQPISVEDLYRYDDFSRLHPERHATTTLGDDVIAPSATGACWFDVEVVSTDKEPLEFKIVEKGNTYGFVKFNLPKNHKGSNLIMGLGYFPGNYKFSLNGANDTKYSDCAGRVCFPVDGLRSGENTISWKVGQSPIETFFNYVTLVFFVLWVVVLIINLSNIHKDKRKTIYFILTLLVFGTFLFFRSYNLDGRLIFGWDQERDAIAATNVLSGKLTLLGPRVQGPLGFFLPPYFFYLLAPFYALVGSSPIATAVFIVFWSILFFGLTYWVISKIFNMNVALVFLTLWAVNPMAISIDTIAWNPVVVPALFVVLIYLFYLCLKSPNSKLLLLLGLVFGLGVSFHTQFLFTSLLLIPLFKDLIKSKSFAHFKYLIVGAVIPFLPILLFDLRHNFLNIKQFLGYSLNPDILDNRALMVWGRVSSFVVGLNPTVIVGLCFYTLISVILIFLVIRNKDEIQKKIFTGLTYVWMFSLPLFYLILKSPSEYYFNYLLVVAAIAVACLISIKRLLGIVILILVVLSFALRSLPLLRDTKFSLKEKTNSVIFLKKIVQNSNPFDVSFDVPYNEDSGFRYLLGYYKVKYSSDPKDPLIEFVVPINRKLTAFPVGTMGIYIPQKWLNNNWLK